MLAFKRLFGRAPKAGHNDSIPRTPSGVIAQQTPSLSIDDDRDDTESLSEASTFSSLDELEVQRVQAAFAAHEAALASVANIHVRVVFDENGEMTACRMEPLHEYNPCQELSPVLKQGELDGDGESKAKGKKTRRRGYEQRLRSAIQIVRGAKMKPAVSADAQDALRFSGKFMRAVKTLHAHRSVDRDIKADNVVVCYEQPLNLVEFL